MSFAHRVTQMLHDEHMATVEMLNGLEEILAKAGKSPPDTGSDSVRNALGTAAALIEEEVHSHFSFEEQSLFTRLAEMGDEAIGAHLTEEHQIMLPVGEKIAAMARQALESGFTQETWTEFRGAASELIERMLAHIQKEEMALLPVLDEILDAETDFALSEQRNQ